MSTPVSVPAPRGGHEDVCAVISVPVAGHVVVLAGHLDVHGAADVRIALAEAIAAGSGDLVVDLAGVALADPIGVGVLVGAHRQASRGGRTLLLRDVPDAVGRLLHMMRLDRVLRLTRSLPI